jgi:transposase-like protein
MRICVPCQNADNSRLFFVLAPECMPMAHALAQSARSVQGTLCAQKKGASRAGSYAKGVRAKFRYGVVRFEKRIFLNFDLTPFASRPHLLLRHLTPFAATPGLLQYKTSSA